MNVKNSILILAIAGVSLMGMSSNVVAQSAITPEPVSLSLKEGNFLIDPQTALSFPDEDERITALSKYLNSHIKKISGYTLMTSPASGKKIEFKLLANEANLGEEGYKLRVEPERLLISANSHKGLFYGLQSLFQTLPAVRTNAPLSVPCMEVIDYPRIGWRGMMLDVSRHFYPVEAIKEVIDLLALYKMNVFHWHLCDNEGWRLEIKKYPKLTSVGAWRQEVYGSVFYAKDPSINLNDTYLYGGYYTQEEAKEVVRYAMERNITVIPEIEMPGHSGAALAAYPQFSCNRKVQPTPNSTVVNGVTGNTHVNFEYCAGNDSSFLFLQDILGEVMAIFPSEYIHIGGDEVEKVHWSKCKLCQMRIKKEKLKNVDELQSYFIKRMEKFLIANNKKLLGWDEILEGGLAPSATVMSWRGEKGGVRAAKMKHEVIMSPSNPLYFNRYQAGPDGEPHAAKHSINTLERVYNYNPFPDELKADDIAFIKGCQFAIWTEFIPSLEHLEYMLLPRLPAISEALWTPLKNKDFGRFTHKLNQWHYRAWQQKGIRFHQGSFKK